MKIARRIILVGLVALFVSIAVGDVRVPHVLGSNMVLQRKSEVNIWGWAEPGEEITVSTCWKASAKTKAAADGKWLVKIKTPKAGGPHEITIKGKNTITLDNILIGEVWLASGQSNMEMPLAKVGKGYTGIKDAAKEIATANYPEIRLLQVGNFSSKEPLDDIRTGISMYDVPVSDCKWKACSPETIPTFSSTAYFFARKLHKELGIPVGIIDSSWGGTFAENWMPVESLKKLGYKNQVKQAENFGQNPAQKVPTRLFNGMIHPLLNFSIRGAIWYQGESNVMSGRQHLYKKLFPAMITSWRKEFNQGDFPFYYVQIAPWKYSKPSQILREAQMLTLSLNNTGMAVTMDIANLTDIHPKNKQEVGRRLALWAIAKDYGKTNLVYSGPIYKSMKVEGDKIRISFDYTGSGLKTMDGKEISHLTIAGEDKKFVAAKGIIEGNTIIVSAATVTNPVSVRYGWSNTAEPNLANKEGLPASSFRTDDWPG